jgi:hypothetical protein
VHGRQSTFVIFPNLPRTGEWHTEDATRCTLCISSRRILVNPSSVYCHTAFSLSDEVCGAVSLSSMPRGVDLGVCNFPNAAVWGLLSSKAGLYFTSWDVVGCEIDTGRLDAARVSKILLDAVH